MENVVGGCTDSVILNADSEDFSGLGSQLRLSEGLAGSNPVDVVSLPIPGAAWQALLQFSLVNSRSSE